MTRNQTKLTLGTHEISHLERAIEAWRTARYRLDVAPDWETIYRYNFAVLHLEAAYWCNRAGAEGFRSEFETFRLRLIEQEKE